MLAGSAALAGATTTTTTAGGGGSRANGTTFEISAHCTGGSNACATLLGLLVGLLRHLQHLHQALALVRPHRPIDVRHPRTLAALHRSVQISTISHFVY